MAYRKTYTSTIDVDVEEVLGNMSSDDKKEIFIDQLDSVLDIGEALSCYSESDLLDYIRNNYKSDDIFDTTD